jgi:hypothetical protein
MFSLPCCASAELFFSYCDSNAALPASASCNKRAFKKNYLDRTRLAPCEARWIWAGAVLRSYFICFGNSL